MSGSSFSLCVAKSTGNTSDRLSAKMSGYLHMSSTTAVHSLSVRSTPMDTFSRMAFTHFGFAGSIALWLTLFALSPGSSVLASSVVWTWCILIVGWSSSVAYVRGCVSPGPYGAGSSLCVVVVSWPSPVMSVHGSFSRSWCAVAMCWLLFVVCVHCHP